MTVTDAARIVALSGTVVLALGVLWHRRGGASTSSLAFGTVLAGVAMLTGAAFYAWLVLPLIFLLPRDPIVGGALAGWILGAMPVALAAPLLLTMAVVGRTLPKVEDPIVVLCTVLAAIAGSAVFGILLLQFFALIQWSGAFALLLVPVSIALLPFTRQLFQTPVLFAVLRRRQRHLEPPYANELRTWVADVTERWQIEKVDVLFGPANHRNAAAVGFWPFTRFIMLGDGLTRVMPMHEARAIVAHEIAHVVRSDVRNQFVLWIALASAWTYGWIALSMNLGLSGVWWRMASGIGMLGIVWAAGRYSRRCEFAADRLAVEITDDPQAVADALERMVTLTGVPADRGFVTHPSTRERIEKLRGRSGL